MKAPDFWYQQAGAMASLLAPFESIYRAGGKVRAFFAKPYRAQKPIFCIGNLVVGGAGKTPTSIALAELLLENGHRPGLVARGYGGLERGPLKIDLARHSARDVGDEPLLLARTAPTWIGRDRVAAIKLAEQECSHVLLDDGLQNPNIRPDRAFLVIDSAAAFGNGHLIPAGPLRETLEEAMKRITAIILIGENIEQKIAGRARCPIIRANWQPNLPSDFPGTDKFFAFAGIARPEKFYATCRAAGLTLVGTEDFADHHFFTEAELQRLQNRAAAEQARLLTTEKDWVRLSDTMRKQITPFPVKLTFDDVEVIKRVIG